MLFFYGVCVKKPFLLDSIFTLQYLVALHPKNLGYSKRQHEILNKQISEMGPRYLEQLGNSEVTNKNYS